MTKNVNLDEVIRVTGEMLNIVKDKIKKYESEGDAFMVDRFGFTEGFILDYFMDCVRASKKNETTC